MEYVNDEEPREEISPEEFLNRRKAQMRRNSWWSLGAGIFLFAGILAVVSYISGNPEISAKSEFANRGFFSLLFGNIFSLLGLFFILAGLWGLYEARRLTLEDLILTPEAAEFFRQSAEIRPFYSYIILGCLIAVFVAQVVTDGNDQKSVETAGLIGPNVLGKGEYWRVLTSGVLHAGLLHIYFNAQAFYGFGGLIEVVADRARMALVFLLAIVGGNVCSLIFMSESVSVGASGGIMGLIGYLAVYGFRRKRQLPPDFLRNLLVNIGLIAFIGIVGYQFINNFAHFGGLLVGCLYGLLTIPRDLSKNPRAISAVTEGAGMISTGIIVFISILTILLITGKIEF